MLDLDAELEEYIGLHSEPEYCNSCRGLLIRRF